MDRRQFAFGLVLGSTVVATAARPQAAAPTKVLPASDIDVKYQSESLQTGMLSLETSKVAQQSADNPKVKQFANFEVAEQETLGDIIKSMTTDHSGKSTNPAPRGDARSGNAAAPQTSPTVETAAALKKLQALKGAQFDEEYVKSQIAGHERLLTIQEDYIAKGEKFRDTCGCQACAWHDQGALDASRRSEQGMTWEQKGPVV